MTTLDELEKLASDLHGKNYSCDTEEQKFLKAYAKTMVRVVLGCEFNDDLLDDCLKSENIGTILLVIEEQKHDGTWRFYHAIGENFEGYPGPWELPDSNIRLKFPTDSHRKNRL